MRKSAHIFSVVLFLIAVVKPSSGDHGGSCACEAESFGFTIDCSNQDAMTQALADLQSNGCQTDCSSDACHKNFFIIQSHHDYCLEDQVPAAVEEGLHDFEIVCHVCDISRQANPDFPACPEVSCKVDNEGDIAYQALLDNGCDADCSSQVCIDNFRILVAVHDFCPGSSLSEEAEEGLHDLEEPCAANGCNAVLDDGSQLVCEETATSTAAHASKILALAGTLAGALVTVMI